MSAETQGQVRLPPTPPIVSENETHKLMVGAEHEAVVWQEWSLTSPVGEVLPIP